MNKGWYELSVNYYRPRLNSTYNSASTANRNDSVGTNVTDNPPVVYKVKVSIGEVFVISGQSNAQGLFTSEVAPITIPNIEAVRVNPYRNTDANGQTVGSDRNDPTKSSYLGGYFPPYARLAAISSNDPSDKFIGPAGNSLWHWGSFGAKIANEFQVPVAFFNAAWGGTTVTAWAESSNPDPSINRGPLGLLIRLILDLNLVYRTVC